MPHSSASPDNATHEPAASTPAKVQLTPADWIAAATDVLRDKSIDAVRVDVLAKVLNVTRGSFYWHFKDRNDLLERVLQRWRDAATEQIIERFQKTPPQQRIGEFLTLPFRGQTAQNSASIELAIRAWARRDALARQAVETIDSYRLAYVAQCFGELGFSAEEAKMRAFVVYGYMVSEALLRNQGSESERLARRAFVERMVLAP